MGRQKLGERKEPGSQVAGLGQDLGLPKAQAPSRILWSLLLADRAHIPHSTKNERKAQRPKSPAPGAPQGELSPPGQRGSLVALMSLGGGATLSAILHAITPYWPRPQNAFFEAVRADMVVQPILQVRELWPREVKLPIQGHTANQLPSCLGPFLPLGLWLKTRSSDGA